MSSPRATARESFVAQRRARWDRLEGLLDRARLGGATDWAELAALYRDATADLARARTLGMSEEVLSYLDRLSGRAHNRLYGAGRGVGWGFIEDLVHGFPAAMRRQWAFVLAAHLLFYVPFFVGVIGPLTVPGFAQAVLPEAQLEMMEAMYSETIGRETGQDAAMAGFYVWNNVGIAFRCFATGALFGLGSIFYLVYNGVVLGTVEGFLWQEGRGWNLLDFTIGHTPWELTGIAISGAAGLRMGWALMVTEGRTRLGSLRAASREIYRLILGAAALLLVAALIEGFWSAGPAPTWLKIIVGALGAIAIVLWVLVGGRNGRGRA